MLASEFDSYKVFSVLSLFSGGGLLDLGFINKGFQIEHALEINEKFIQGYNFAMDYYMNYSKREIIKSKLIVHKSINNIMDVSEKHTQIKIGNQYKGLTGIIGGPPCQDYSIGGQNKGLEGERGRLILSYLRLVQLVKPKFIFFENVEGLYKTRRHRKGFLYLIERLNVLGYELWYDIINPLTYGLPQDRARVIVVGFRNDIVNKLKDEGYIVSHDNDLLKNSNQNNFVFKWPKIRFNNPKKDVQWPTMWEFQSESNIQEILRISREYKSIQVSTAFEGLTNEIPNQNEFFNPRSSKFWTIAEGDTYRKSFKRLHRYRYSPTVAYGNNEVHLHPTEARRLSVREALRLQTVPDEYVLPSYLTLTTKFKMISNGVPTAQAELIAGEIRETLLKYFSLGINEAGY
ncbi:DNA cytosine methyltransferase [Paenibacillus dendritiformis]|uniref:DNA cytosine methyltransferase n=1 Tax=Paenibacillus dendritiformis TaxID=130049 RepID=UPI0015EBE0E6|nr:DNA cytosine methyltransferase [Paenibacillus dendritiformis]